MNDQQKMMFITQYNAVRKNPTTGVLLTLFLGGLGAHRFYLGQIGLGVFYALFCWTFIPGVIALIECFMVGDRVRQYNLQQADFVAMQIRALTPIAEGSSPFTRPIIG